MWTIKDKTVVFLQSLAVTFTALLLIMGLVRFWYWTGGDFTESEYFRTSMALERNWHNDPLNLDVAIRLGDFYYFLAKSEENWLNNDITNEYEILYYRDQINKWQQLGYDITAYKNDLERGAIDNQMRESFQQQQMQVCSDAYDKALNYYYYARAIDPNVWGQEEKFRVGLIFLKKGINYSGEAEQLFQQAFRDGCQNSEVLTCMGNVAYQRRDFPAAVEYYQKALEQNEDDLVVNFNLALALFEIKEYPQAKYWFNNILQRETVQDGYYQGMLSHIHMYLGQIALADNQLDTAQRQLEQALFILPTLVEAHYYLGLTYEHKDMPEEARMSYRNALELNPNNRKIREALAGIST